MPRERKASPPIALALHLALAGKEIFRAAESGDDDAFTSLIPADLSLHNEDGCYLLDVTAAAGHPRAPRGRGESGGCERARDPLRPSGSRGCHLLLGLAITIAALLALASASESDHKVRCSPSLSLPTSPCTTRTAATSSMSPPLPAILGRPADAGRAEDASEREIRSARDLPR